MSGSESLVDLVARLRAGDDRVVAVLFDRYAAGLMKLAERKLGWLTHKSDPESLVNSAVFSFWDYCRKPNDRDGGAGSSFNDWQAVWALLAQITVRKCCRRWEFWTAAARDPGREIPLEARGATENDEAAIDLAPAAREPGAEAEAALRETLEKLMEPFGERERRIIELRMGGSTNEEIAGELECSERKVSRIMARARQRLERIAGDSAQT